MIHRRASNLKVADAELEPTSSNTSNSTSSGNFYSSSMPLLTNNPSLFLINKIQIVAGTFSLSLAGRAWTPAEPCGYLEKPEGFSLRWSPPLKGVRKKSLTTAKALQRSNGGNPGRKRHGIQGWKGSTEDRVRQGQERGRICWSSQGKHRLNCGERRIPNTRNSGLPPMVTAQRTHRSPWAPEPAFHQMHFLLWIVK